MVNFNTIINNKNIIHIPIYSMFSRINSKINLTCDGNVNRYLTTYYLNNSYKSLIIYVPQEENSENFREFERFISYLPNNYICLKQSPEIKLSALYQRSKEFANNIDISILPESTIIFEGQELGIKLLENKNRYMELIYWCPVCATNKKSRSFLNKDKEKNEYIFKHQNLDYIIVASIDQYDYLKEIGVSENKICLITDHIDRTLPMFSYHKDINILSFIDYIEKENKKVIYLPFRLSDEGYKFEEIINTIYESKIENYIILFPNLNNVSIEELLKKFNNNFSDIENILRNKCYTISSSRDTFYTILDYCKNIIIPYFEDLNFINHSTIQELFKENKLPVCKIVTTINELKEKINE